MVVNVLLVTYNQSEYISQAVESILMQRIEKVDGVLPQVRVIIADDASTDDTLRIIRSYEGQSQFPFVYLSHEPNMGHVLNYKRAFAACDGYYICVLEGDDYWCNPYHILNHIKFMEEHRECVLCSNRPIEYNVEKKTYSLSYFPYDEDIKYITAYEEASGNKVFNLSSCIIRSSSLIGLPDFLYEVEMLDWLLEILLAEKGFLCVRRYPTSVYRVKQNGLWAGLSAEGKKSLIIKQIREYDELLNKRYNKEFTDFIDILLPPPQKFISKLKKFIPPFFIMIIKAFLPPIVVKNLKR